MGILYGFLSLLLVGTAPSLANEGFPGATYLGGSRYDGIRALAIHPISGKVYVTGTTTSFDFPGTTGGFQPAINGLGAAFVARLDASLSKLEQATFFGGNFNLNGVTEDPHAIAFDPASGAVYVAGYTPSCSLPQTAGGAQPKCTGDGDDGFIARFDESLTRLEQATYLGGSDLDEIQSLAVDPFSGDVYAAGRTHSADFPGTDGGAQPAKATYCAGFVARLNSALTSLAGATYLNGCGARIAIRPGLGDVYAATLDGFLFRLDRTLAIVRQSNSIDASFVEALVLNTAARAVYIAGTWRESESLVDHGFVGLLDEDLNVIETRRRIGGDGADPVRTLAVHPITGDVYVAGSTLLKSLPGTTGAVQPANSGSSDAFIVRFDPGLDTIKAATFLGGSNWDEAVAVAIDPVAGHLYVAGTTYGDFPTTVGATQRDSAGGADAFLAHMTSELASSSLRPRDHPAPPRSSPRTSPRTVVRPASNP